MRNSNQIGSSATVAAVLLCLMSIAACKSSASDRSEFPEDFKYLKLGMSPSDGLRAIANDAALKDSRFSAIVSNPSETGGGYDDVRRDQLPALAAQGKQVQLSVEPAGGFRVAEFNFLPTGLIGGSFRLATADRARFLDMLEQVNAKFSAHAKPTSKQMWGCSQYEEVEWENCETKVWYHLQRNVCEGLGARPEIQLQIARNNDCTKAPRL